MKKLLLTGGSGFFGKSILSYIKNNRLSYDVTILSRHARTFIQQNKDILPDGVSYIQDDIRDFVMPCRFDYIIHAATPAVVGLSDGEMRSIIVDGMNSLVSAAKASGCGRILFTSSGAVYGPYSRAISENDECMPATAYGRGKKEAEDILIRSGLNFTIARCFAFSGKFLNKDIHFAIGNFIKDALSGNNISINGDGRAVRSYLDQEDLCRMLFILMEKAACRSIYNIGSPFPISIYGLANAVKRTLLSKSEIRVLGMPEKDASRGVYYPDMSKFEHDFSFKDYIKLEDSIRSMV